MDKTIDIFVKGSYLKKNNNAAGIRGEGNATILHIIFDETWAETAKSITFWDSRGETSVKRTLTADLLVELSESLLEYNVPIPSEPMKYAGWMSFVIDGFKDGKRIRSVQTELLVEDALIDDDAGEPVDPTPTQAEQLQEQMEGVLTVVQMESKIAVDAANKAKEHAEDAVETYNLIFEKAKEAEGYISEVESYVEEASGYVELAAQQVALAEEKVIEAATYATDAEGFADDAKRYRDEVAENVSGDFVTNTAFNTAIEEINNSMSQLGTGDMNESVYDPQGKQTDVFKYVDDAVDGITAEDVGARPDTWLPTAADVGAVAKTGDTMTGNLTVEKSSPYLYLKNSSTERTLSVYMAGDNTAAIANRKDNNNYNGLYLTAETSSQDRILRLMRKVDGGTTQYYNVYGEHNITKGTTDLTAGTSTLTTGAIYLVYE